MDKLIPFINESEVNWPPLLKIDPFLAQFLDSLGYEAQLSKISKESQPGLARAMKIFSWFNAFKLFKYLHYARDKGRPDVTITKCIENLFPKINLELGVDLLTDLRILQRYDLQANYNNQWRKALITN